MTTRLRVPCTVALACFFVLASARATPAQLSVDGGYFGTGDHSSIGAAFSLQLFKTPVIPLTLEATGAVPFDGRGYVATFDARFRIAGTTIGAGAGVGNLDVTTKTDILYQAILAQSILPHLSVEARYYWGNSRPSSIFAGLRLSI